MMLRKLTIFLTVFIMLLVTGCSNKSIISAFNLNQPKYYELGSPEIIIKNGSEEDFDSERAHTLSVVELNKNGYRFWGYYTGYDGKNIKNDSGLVYSNDLKNWVKDSDKPIVPNLRWPTAVVVDGTVNIFGTRNYGSNSYIVRLVSDDGKNFNEVGPVVSPAVNEYHQNPFIFYDEAEGMYRLYYFHSIGKSNLIEEKHSPDITRLASSKPTIVTGSAKRIIAAPSVVYRNNTYWLTVETLDVSTSIWKTLAFYSDNPVKGYKPVKNHELLISNDACYFPYIFDNRLNGIYSHTEDDKIWVMLNRTFDFPDKNTITLDTADIDLVPGSARQLKATIKYADGSTKDITSSATWTTSDNSIAKVKKGCISAQNNGTAVITVSFGGCSTTANVEIRNN